MQKTWATAPLAHTAGTEPYLKHQKCKFLISGPQAFDPLPLAIQGREWCDVVLLCADAVSVSEVVLWRLLLDFLPARAAVILKDGH